MTIKKPEKTFVDFSIVTGNHETFVDRTPEPYEGVTDSFGTMRVNKVEEKKAHDRSRIWQPIYQSALRSTAQELQASRVAGLKYAGATAITGVTIVAVSGGSVVMALGSLIAASSVAAAAILRKRFVATRHYMKDGKLSSDRTISERAYAKAEKAMQPVCN